MTVKTIKPDPINFAEVRRDLDDALLAGVEEVKALAYMTYHNWESENYPEFKVDGPKTVAGVRQVEYSTVSTPYVWVEDGTRGPYPIKAKNVPMLKYKLGGMPKTKPGRFQSMAGAPGAMLRQSKEVTHPGIEARDFFTHIQEQMDDSMPGHTELSMSKGKSY